MRISEDQARTIEAAYKLATLVAILIGGFWTVNTYFANKQSENATRVFELQKPFFDKEVDYCIQATTAAADVVTATNETERSAAEKKFLSIYYGPLTVIENMEVRISAAGFANCLKSNLKCDPPIELQMSAFAETCHLVLTRGWVPNPPGNMSLRPY